MVISPEMLADFDSTSRVTTEVSVSMHAVQRFRQRTNLVSIRDIKAFVAEAIVWGRTMDTYSDVYREFLLERTNHGCFPITYRGLLLLLSPDLSTVITVYPLPEWFFMQLPRCNPSENRMSEWMMRGLNRFYTLFHQLFTGKLD